MDIADIDTQQPGSMREQVRRYIEGCRLDDGGFFFARIPPSSAMDTYYAVKTLSVLSLEPEHADDVKNFFLGALEKDSPLGISGLFAAVEALGELNSSVQLSARYRDRLSRLRNSLGGFGAVDNLDCEAVSELETTYRVLKILDRLGMDFDAQPIIDFVLKFKNKDGGFGKNSLSTLASTFYATEIFLLTGYSGDELEHTAGYLRGREHMWKLNFIEDIYWMSNGLANLGQKPRLAEWMISFVKACRRNSGGFARKDIMGIATLEDTYYAVSILKALACL